MRPDTEVVVLLRDDPKLLALADAVCAAGRPAIQNRQRRYAAVLAAAAALLAISLALISPWSRDGGGILDRALAAVGSGPVTHAVLESAVPASSAQRLEIESGRAVPLRQTTELWYDKRSGVLHVVVRLNGAVYTDWLKDRQRTLTQAGPVGLPTGAPGDNPEIATFADGYQAALASGKARVVGDALVEGKEVTWIEFPSGFDRVAVDRDSGRPLFVKAKSGRGVLTKVLLVESGPGNDADLSAPTVTQPQNIQLAEEYDVSIEQAKSVLGRPALWAGRNVAGNALGKATLRTWTYSWARRHEGPRRVHELRLIYGNGAIEIGESTNPLTLQSPGGLVPPGGYGDYYAGALHLQHDGLYVTIRASTSDLAVRVARELVPLSN
jgi:hypothetical protein